MTKLPLKSVIVLLLLASAPLVAAQNLQIICSFNGTNGSIPQAALTMGLDGNLYGTTSSGGSEGKGTVFKVTTNGALTTLVSFANTNGANPYAALTLGNDGVFYATTSQGGISTNGTVFKVTTNGTLTTLVSFNVANGQYPFAALAVGNDANFYGTTTRGGSGVYYGTAFKVTMNGTLTTLVSFAGTNGASPNAGLTQGYDGNFYGTTSFGGDNGNGTVFRITTNGTLTTLVSFANANGAGPNAGLTSGADGNFYSTTTRGGSGDYGTVFQMTTNGTLTTLVSFANTNGLYPSAGLTLGYDGDFYGATQQGGITNPIFPQGMGTLFKVSTNGALTTLVFFDNTNGQYPSAGLTLGYDGNFYGSTLYGGTTNSTYTQGMGTVFRLLLPPPSIPIITIQPHNLTNNVDATVTFLVTAIGSNLLTFQWQKNGTNLVEGGNLSGATSNALTITGISASDAANYSVIVSNANGSVTSSNATLTVIDPPVITAQPRNLLALPGTNVAFSVSLSGSASSFRYQWRFNGTNLLNATNASYTIPSVATNKAGNYSVVVTNAAGVATSSNAALTVVLSPRSETNYASSTATFTATAFSPQSLSYQWQRNGTNLVDGGKLTGATNGTLTIASISDEDAAVYNAIVSDVSASVTTSNAVLTVSDFLFIATQPLSQTVGVGSNVTFTVMAYGAPPFVFQWYYSNGPVGLPTSGSNVSSYTLTNVQTNQSGNYSVQVVNGLGSLASSNALLTVKVFPPFIELQPSNQKAMLGGNVSFNVSVTGTAPFRYQWRFNNAAILDATNAAYAIQAVVATNTGNYSVVVTNLAGSVTSSNALLTVIVPPTLTLQLSAGYPLLNLSGMLSSNFIVEYNPNLADTNWIHLLSLTNLSVSPYLFLDPAGVDQPSRFYRAFME